MKFKAITLLAGQKISFDMRTAKFRDYETLYRKHAKGELSGTDIGIPCRPNRLVILDVDVPSKSHAFDGRQWIKDNWNNYPELASTYSVNTPSGGQHFYLRLPPHIDEFVFNPRKAIVRGVDVIWNGYVVAPPTKGYEPKGNLKDIKEISSKLIEVCGCDNNVPATIDTDFKVNIPLSNHGVAQLLQRLKNIMPTQSPTYSEWIEGIFSICAAVNDEQLREECLIAFTNNQAYKEGDDELALQKARGVDPHGDIGPGTIIKMLNNWDTVPKEDNKTRAKITFNMICSNPDLHIVAKDNKEIIIPTESNACCIISSLFPHDYHKRADSRYESMYYNKRKKALVVNNRPIDCERKEYAYDLLNRIQQHYRLPHFKYSVVSMGLEMFIRKRSVDPLVEEITSFEWDRKPRVDRFFLDYCKAEEGSEAYLKGAAKTFWRSLLYRIMCPGFKCDEVIVLQGPEGLLKTSFARILSYDHFFACGDKRAFEDRDCLLNMNKAVLVELEEMVSVIRGDPDQAKGFITRTHDYVRNMFGRESMEVPRSFMLFGTCNRRYILKSSHGKRRFLPIKVGQNSDLNRQMLEDDIDQLYAEAYEDYKLGKKNYGLIASVDKNSMVSDHIITHPWREALKENLKNTTEISDSQLYAILRVACVLGSQAVDEKSSTTVYDIMDGLGWHKKGDIWRKKQVYVPINI